EVEVLDEANARLSPPDTIDVRRWEAWYPSVMRRLLLRTQTANQGSDRLLSNWHSWRESYLAWPDPTWTPVGGAPQSFLDANNGRLSPRHPLLTWIAETTAQGDSETDDRLLKDYR